MPAGAATRPPQLAKSVTIYRDNYGVPHVYGPTDAGCIFGYIYAQAEDNFWQIEDSYIRALGRASEIYGSKTLDDDRLVRALEIPKLAQEEYERASPETKKLVDASADGLNYFLARNPQVKPRLITHFEPWYIYAFNRYALYYKFIFGKSGLEARRNFERVGIARLQHVGYHARQKRRWTRHAVHQSAPAVLRRRPMVRRTRPQRRPAGT